MSIHKVIENSQLVVSSIISHISKKVVQQAEINMLINQGMNCYSSNRMMSLVNQLGDQLLALPNGQIPIQDENQPIKLMEDCHMSMEKIQMKQQSSKIDCQNANTMNRISQTRNSTRYNKNLLKNKQSNNSLQTNSLGQNSDKKSKSRVSSSKKQICKPLQKVEHKILDDEKQINQLRKTKQEQIKERKFLQQYKNIQNKLNRVRKQKVGYDYDGKIIDIKPDNKNNLVSKTIHTTIYQQIETNNQNINKNSMGVVFVQTHQVKNNEERTQRKRQESPKMKNKKNLEQLQHKNIQFSGINDPLQRLKVTRGVVATFQKQILKKQQKEPNDQQVRRQIANGSKKMSRKQYTRLKTATVRTQTHKTQRQDKESNNANKIISVSKKQILYDQDGSSRVRYNNSGVRRRAMTESLSGLGLERVQIGDQKLKNFILQHNNQQVKQQINRAHHQRPASETKKIYELNKIDRYNLDYSRGKHCASALKKISQSGNNVILPKKQNINIFPKLRQRVKQAAVLRKTGKNYFQQTLRI